MWPFFTLHKSVLCVWVTDIIFQLLFVEMFFPSVYKWVRHIKQSSAWNGGKANIKRAACLSKPDSNMCQWSLFTDRWNPAVFLKHSCCFVQEILLQRFFLFSRLCWFFRRFWCIQSSPHLQLFNYIILWWIVLKLKWCVSEKKVLELISNFYEWNPQ